MSIKDLLDLVGKDKKKKESEKTAQKIAAGVGIAAAAAAAGAVAGVLFAPKAGKETREDIKNKATDVVGNIKETVQEKVDVIKKSKKSADSATPDVEIVAEENIAK